MAAPNILNATSIYGKTIGAALGTTVTTTILTCPTDKVLRIKSIIAANIDNSNTSSDVTVIFRDSSAGTDYRMANTVTVPGKTTLVVSSSDSSIFLEESDEIRAGASTVGDIELIISYEELDDA